MEIIEIKNKLDVIISTSLNHHDFSLSDDLKPKDVTGWDSLANAMIITSIENEFGIKFKFSDMIAWHNVGELTRLIEKKLS